MVAVRFISILIVLFMSPFATADIHFGADAGLIQDQKSITSRDIIQTTFYDANLYLQASRNYQFYLGFEYIQISTTQPNTVDTTTATLTSSNAMAGMKYVFGRKKLFSVSLMGSPFIQASYKVTGATSDLWSGAAFASKVSIHPDLTNSLKLCVSIVYYSATYTSKSESSGSTAVSSFSRSLLIPTLGLQFNF